MKAEVCVYLIRNAQWFRPISILSPVFGLDVECMGNGDCNQQPPRISRSYFLLSPRKPKEKSLNLKKRKRTWRRRREEGRSFSKCGLVKISWPLTNGTRKPVGRPGQPLGECLCHSRAPLLDCAIKSKGLSPTVEAACDHSYCTTRSNQGPFVIALQPAIKVLSRQIWTSLFSEMDLLAVPIVFRWNTLFPRWKCWWQIY